MTQSPDPWQIARTLLVALDAVLESWKVDPTAPGQYRRVKIAALKQAEHASRSVPSYLRRLRKVGGAWVYDATAEEVQRLADATDAVLARSIPGGGSEVTVHAEDLEAMRRALNTLRAALRDTPAA